MSELRLPEKHELKFVLLGSGYSLCLFCKLLIENNFPKPIIVAQPKEYHKRDQHLLKGNKSYIDLFEFSKDNSIEVIESSIVNDSELIKKLLQKGCNVAFSIGCRSIIKKKFLDAFDNRVFNIHPSYLPAERGGGTISWRIMNGQKFVAVTIHLLDEGIDTGPIVLQNQRTLEQKNPILDDYLTGTNELCEELFKKLITSIDNQEALKLTTQNKEEGTYLPRLYTETNGAIDWSWTASEIVQFILAFGEPYPGAFTFVNGKKICIIDAHVEKSDVNYHPFVYGKLIRILTDGSVDVAAKNGLVRIKKIVVDGKKRHPLGFLKLIDTLCTPPDILFESRSKTVNVKDMQNPPDYIQKK